MNLDALTGNRFFLYENYGEENEILRAAQPRLYTILHYMEKDYRLFYGSAQNHPTEITKVAIKFLPFVEQIADADNNMNKTACAHQWSYLTGSAQNETMKCLKCGATG